MPVQETIHQIDKRHDAAEALPLLQEWGPVLSALLASGGEVVLPKLGRLSVVEGRPRKCRNFRTGEVGTTRGPRTVVFEPAVELERVLNPARRRRRTG